MHFNEGDQPLKKEKDVAAEAARGIYKGLDLAMAHGSLGCGRRWGSLDKKCPPASTRPSSTRLCGIFPDEYEKRHKYATQPCDIIPRMSLQEV